VNIHNLSFAQAALHIYLYLFACLSLSVYLSVCLSILHTQFLCGLGYTVTHIML